MNILEPLMLDSFGALEAASCFACALPLLLVPVLMSFPDLWEGSTCYSKPDEYGEPKAWRSAMRTPLNACSSLGYYYAGVYTLHNMMARTLRRSPQNCSDAEPQWHIAFGIALLWVGLASFLFHASLTERWRLLDAGATMGVTAISTMSTVYRSIRAALAPAPRRLAEEAS